MIEYSDNLICPHCAAIYDSPMDYFPLEQDRLVECTCDCGEIFYSRMYVSVSYSSYKDTKCNS